MDPPFRSTTTACTTRSRNEKIPRSLNAEIKVPILQETACPPEMLLVKAGDVELNPGPLDRPGDIQEEELVNLAYDIPPSKYIELCIALGITYTQSQAILTRHLMDIRGSLIEVFLEWKYKQTDGPDYRNAIAKALYVVNLEPVASKVITGGYHRQEQASFESQASRPFSPEFTIRPGDIQEEELVNLAHEVPPSKYAELCIALGITYKRSQAILTRHLMDIPGSLIKVFIEWKNKQRDGTNYRNAIAEALRAVKLDPLAAKVIRDIMDTSESGDTIYQGDSSKEYYRSSDRLQERELLSLSQNVSPENYYSLCIALGFSHGMSKNILTKNLLDVSASVFEILSKWKMKQVDGSDCRRDLVDILRREELHDLANKISKGTYYSRESIPTDRLLEAFESALKDGKSKLKRGRVMFVGESGVGKTSLLKRLIEERFDPNESSTVGVDQDKIYTVDVSGWKEKEKHEIESEPIKETARVTQRKMTSPDVEKSSSVKSDDYSEGETAKAKGLQLPGEYGEVPIDVPSDTKSKVLAEAKETDHMQGESDEMTYHLWDFGGQRVYHITHPIFLTWRAVFVVVFDLTRTHTEIVDELHFWLMSIYTYAVCPEDLPMTHKNVSDGNESTKVIIVGTHADDVREEVQGKIAEVRTGLQQKSYSDMITGYFEVDNASDSESQFQEIRHAVDDQMNRVPFMKEEVPTRWVLFETLLFKLTSLGTVHLPFSELNRELEKLGIRDQEADAVLMMFHNVGKIIYFPGIELVILNPQWLNMMVTKIVAVGIDKEEDALDAWDTLEHEGILTEKLIDHVWKDHAAQKDDMLKIMEKFDLICEIDKMYQTNSSRTGRGRSLGKLRKNFSGRWFFVPCLVKYDEEFKATLKKHDITKARHILDIDFQGFLPVGFVHRLFVTIARWTMEKGCPHLPRFGNEEIIFFIDEKDRLLLETLDAKEMKLSLLVNGSPNADPQALSEFRDVLERLLGYLKEKWARRIEFRLGRKCPNCPKDEHVMLQYKGKEVLVCSKCSTQLDTNLIPLFGEHKEDQPSDGHDAPAPHDSKEQQFFLEEGQVVVTIPPGEPKDGKKVIVETIPATRADLPLKENEAIISIGLKFLPSGTKFEKPVRVTLSHCAIFTKPDQAKIILYSRKNGSRDVKITASAANQIPRCDIREKDLDLYIDHFSDWWIISVIENYFIGIRLVCTPHIPVSPRMDGQDRVYLYLRKDNGRTEKPLPGCELGGHCKQYFIKWGHGPVNISCLYGDTKLPEKELQEEKFHYLDKDYVDFMMNLREATGDRIPGEFFLKQRIETTIPFYLHLHGSNPTTSLGASPSRAIGVRTSSIDVSSTDMPSTSHGIIGATTSRQTNSPSRSPSQEGCTGPVTDELLTWLSKKIPNDKYIDLCEKLLPDDYNRVRNILMKYSNNCETAIRECLAIWKDRTGGSLAELGRILEAAELGGLFIQLLTKLTPADYEGSSKRSLHTSFFYAFLLPMVLLLLYSIFSWYKS